MNCVKNVNFFIEKKSNPKIEPYIEHEQTL